jgi:hypothetical protein
MNKIAIWLASLPLLGRWTLVGTVGLGAAGAAVGLVIGLFVYAPTAPFAAVEMGTPAAIVGAVVGLASSLAVSAGRRLKRR